MGDNDGSNFSDENDVPNMINKELYNHPNMIEKLKRWLCFTIMAGGHQVSKLSTVLTLYNLKFGHQVSDVFFS